MNTLILKKGKEAAISRKHPWIFSGAIARKEGSITNGDVVIVKNFNGDFIAKGHYHQGSIAVRILSYEEESIDQAFFTKNIKQALILREKAGLLGNPKTNVFRLVNAEGDGLPGLIVDWYNGVLVVDIRTDGMARHQAEIKEAFLETLKEQMVAIYFKSEAIEEFEGYYAHGNATLPYEVSENGHRFQVDWEKGQKTGFFIDQRENRRLLGQFSEGKKILNAFSYTGGFSVYALKNGAHSVYSVDSSEAAVELANKNVDLNGVANRHEGIVTDVFEYLKSRKYQFDIIVIDPPAFAKSIKRRHKAVIGYKRLNKLAINAVNPGGLVFTFSCSQIVDKKLFEDTVRAAGIETGRTVRVLNQVGQPSDHPINLFHPEGNYLKGLILHVD